MNALSRTGSGSRLERAVTGQKKPSTSGTSKRRTTNTVVAAVLVVTASLAAAGAAALHFADSDAAAEALSIADSPRAGAAESGRDGADGVDGESTDANVADAGAIDDGPPAVPIDNDGTVELSAQSPAPLIVTDADLDLVLDADGELAPGTSGVGTIQLPTEGPLANAFLDRPLRGAMGVAYGRDLTHLGAHLRGDERYFYTDLGSQPFDLFLGMEQDGAGDLPQRISTAGTGGASMFVAALDADYFYVSTPCEAMIPADAAPTQRPTNQRQNDHADASASEIPGVSLDLSSFDPGGCGLGWSIGGNIAFESILGDRGIAIPADFGAHVVIDGTIPVHPSASLDGELFFRFESDRAEVWANGELDLGVSFMEGAAEVNIPAIRGSFGMAITPTRFDLALTATAGTPAADGSPIELLADLAPVRGHVDVDGQLMIDNGVVLESSFLELSGDISVSPTPVRTASDVEMDDVFAAEALVRIDRVGVLVSGSVSASPLTELSVSGAAQLEFLAPFADASDAYLEVSGSLGLGDTGLGADALLRIDADGALTRGRIDLQGFGQLDVEGRLGANGFQLTGSAEAVVPIGDLDQVAANLVDQTSTDVTLQALNAQIDERVNEIAASNPSKGTELRNTITDLRQAFEEIAAVRETIAYNDRLIAQRWRDHQADIDWHYSLSTFDQITDKIPHGVRLAAIVTEIEALKFANTVQYGYIDAANLVVSTSQQAVIAIIGWDEELNALLSLQTEAYLGTLVGNVLATVLNGADAILDSFGVDGSATGTVTFTVGTDGIGASANLQCCRDGVCEQLAGATVTLSPTVEVCATMLGVPACAAL